MQQQWPLTPTMLASEQRPVDQPSQYVAETVLYALRCTL